MARKSIREKHYQHSKYIAEYFCTLPNVGLFAVALSYDDRVALFAAMSSALSHAIPLQRLHDLDLVGVAMIFLKVAYHYDVFLEREDVLATGIAAMMINIFDTLVTRRYLDTIGPAIHVIWHFAAALALYKFNEGLCEQ